jgi:hypothetical protein
MGPVFLCLGLQICLNSFIAKCWRVLRIFRSKTGKHVVIRTRHVMALVLGSILIEVVIIIIWAAIAPVQWRHIVVLGAYGFPVASYGVCTSSSIVGGALGIVMYGLYFLALVIGAKVSFDVRGIPEEFQETTWISYAILGMCQVFIVAIPTTIAVSFSVSGKFVILSTAITLSVLLFLFFLLVPKVHLVRTGKTLWRKWVVVRFA